MKPPELPRLLAVPNVSEGRDRHVLDAIAAALSAPGTRLLDRHADPDHDRAVFTLAGGPRQLAAAVLAGAREALSRIDVTRNAGVHPHVGALDVAPIVHLTPAQRGAACAEALALAEDLGRELALPVLLYGELAGRRTRAELRRGGLPELARRLATGELRPDFGPARAHPTGGAVLVAARAPLVAFNLLLAPGTTLAQARVAAARLREGGTEGLPGVRALGLALASVGRVQLSFNVEDPARVPLARLVAAARALVPVAAGELVGLAPRAALADLPDDLPLTGTTLVLEQAMVDRRSKPDC